MSGFEVAKQEDGDLVVLYLKGFLDAHTAPRLESALQECVDQQKYKIIVNFEGLSYISSAGLGVFMGFIEDVRRNGGDIKLTNMSSKIYRVFDLLGFPALYEIFENESEAKEKFNSKA
ncbi:MAG: anti-sigma factor antagonist [Calditrichaeota bacterium]|nr:MAG: anti-sigma factor antagonist [Calditrichota bacterium]